MRRSLLAVATVLLAMLPGCGDDDPHRTVAILRAVPVPAENNVALLDQLADAGWEIGENLDVLAPEDADVAADPEHELETWRDDGVDLIFALSTQGAMVAKSVAPDIPVLFIGNDPVASGLVEDARRPEGHLSGVAFRVPPDRTLEVVRSLGGVRTVGLLWPDQDEAAVPIRDGLVAAAKQLDVDLVESTFTDADDVAGAVDGLVESGVDAVILASSPTTVRTFDAIEAAIADTKVPVVANTATCTFAAVVFAPDGPEAYRQLARQAARSLAGTPIAKIPVEDPGSFVLTVRRSAFAAIGREVPPDLLERADVVSD